MKKIILVVSIVAISLMGNSQLSINFDIGASDIELDNLNLNNKINEINISKQLMSGNFDFYVNYKNYLLDMEMIIGHAYDENSTIKSELSSFVTSYYLGMLFNVNKSYKISLLAGYTFGGFSSTLYKKNSQNINLITIGSSTGVLKLKNRADFFSAKIKSELFNVLNLSITYNFSLSNNQWKGYYGEVSNLPKDNFNNLIISLNYKIFSREIKSKATE